MRTCIVCDTEIDLEADRSTTGQTTHGADEVDPDAGTRSFYNGEWYYFCGLQCRNNFLAAPTNYVS